MRESVLVGWLHPTKDSDAPLPPGCAPLLPGGADERRSDSVLGWAAGTLPMQSGERNVFGYFGSPAISSPPQPQFGGIFKKHVLDS